MYYEHLSNFYIRSIHHDTPIPCLKINMVNIESMKAKKYIKIEQIFYKESIEYKDCLCSYD